MRQEQLAKRRREEQRRRQRAAAQEYIQQYQARLQEIEEKKRHASGTHVDAESVYCIGKAAVDGAGKVVGRTARVVGDVAGGAGRVVGGVASVVGGILLFGMLQSSDKNGTYVKPYTRQDGTKVRGHWRNK